jgi:ABC-2 type transport system permease protein
MTGKSQASITIRFFIYLVVIVLISMASTTLFFRADLTANKIYSLSPASREAVATLSEPLTINVFFTENLPAPHNNTKRYLRDLLEEYAVNANRFFNYRFYDVSAREDDVSGKAEENRRMAENYGIYPVEIRMIEKDEIKFKKAYMGLVLIHGDLIEQIPTITSTEGLEYQLTTAIRKLNNKISVLAGLTEPVRVELIMSSSLKAVAPYIGLNELHRLPDAVKEAVQRLNRTNYGRLDFDYRDPGTAGELGDRHNIMILKWPDIRERNIPAGEGAIGLVMTHGDRRMEIALLHVLQLPIFGTRYELMDINTLEETINENIESLIGINMDIGYLASHGTPEIGGAMMMGQMQEMQALQNFGALLSENYTIRRINLHDEAIPPGLECLIIVQPTDQFSDYELYQIDQALMRGARLAIFSDAFREIQQPPSQQFSMNQGPAYQPLQTGLERLLSHYGAQIKPSFIMDKNSYKQAMPTRSGGGERPIYFAPIIKPENINTDLEFLHNIKGLITINNSPVFIDPEVVAANNLTSRILLHTSEESWEMRDQINLNPMFIQPPQDQSQFRRHPIAGMIEGNFPSYFVGKEIPRKPVPAAIEGDDMDDLFGETGKTEARSEKETDDAAGAASVLSEIEAAGDFIAAGRPSTVSVVGSSALLHDNLVDREGQTPNAAFVLNLIDALNGRTGIAVMRSKIQQFNPLDDTTALAKDLIKMVNIAGLPGLVVIFGMMMWLRRRSKRKYIQALFQ